MNWTRLTETIGGCHLTIMWRPFPVTLFSGEERDEMQPHMHVSTTLTETAERQTASAAKRTSQSGTCLAARATARRHTVFYCLTFLSGMAQYPGVYSNRFAIGLVARHRRAGNSRSYLANLDDMSSKGTTAFRLVSLGMLLAFGLNAASQTANVSGAVKDSSQAIVVGASISISRESTGLKQTTSTSEQGFYFFAFLPPGFYTITAEAPGFGAVSRAGLKLDPGQEARLDFTLSLAAIKESVTVRGSASSLQTESSAVGTEVDPQLVQDLPLNGRTFQSLIGLAPGVVMPATLSQETFQGGIVVNGQRSSANYFTVDGVSANVDDRWW